jgi:hypothetical protein
MPTLLIVHHTPSPSLQAMLEAVLAGTRDEAIACVEVVVRPALAATAVDVLAADGYLLGTPERHRSTSRSESRGRTGSKSISSSRTNASPRLAPVLVSRW